MLYEKEHGLSESGRSCVTSFPNVSLVAGGLFRPFTLGTAVIAGITIAIDAGFVGAPVGLAPGAAPTSVSTAVAIAVVPLPAGILVSALTSM
ncbi:hypothetical protein FNYG_07730 [Fusarium nygamai]|uniref:Uncharacterized protein n=1 Tax=Gibberella nygamai TaxID=42673 RepID=A0A2K0W9B2_GIBNY|nr:hypothetical protein FNYG_07730 [Fusarium nygamai]